MVFTNERFLDVTIESWPEWDLKQQPLNSVQTLKPSELPGHQFNSHSEPKVLLLEYTISQFYFLNNFKNKISFVQFQSLELQC